MRTTWKPSPNFSSRHNKQIQSLILHHTSGSYPGDLSWLTNDDSEVSAHYYITKTGRIYQLVKDDKKAWHAGESSLYGKPNVNNFSIGIELENRGDNADPWPDAQIIAVAELVRNKMEEHNIGESWVVDHKTISPGRKRDLAVNFPWKFFWSQVRGGQQPVSGTGLYEVKVEETKMVSFAQREAAITYAVGLIVRGYPEVDLYDIHGVKWHTYTKAEVKALPGLN